MSSDLYVHHHLEPTAWQYDNLVALARHLITRSPLLRQYERLVFSEIEAERAPLPPAAVIEGRKMPAMMPLAHGPLAGVPARPDESWSQYGERAFAMPYGSLLEAWLQRPHWRMTDPTPIGAGLRIAYALDYGVPHNWERISYGADTSDYPHNGFMWDRLDLVAWHLQEGEAEWAIEWERMKGVTFYRGQG
jgi:hypothetical protein